MTSPFQLVLVGGAPRAGTTMLEALVCSGDGVNNIIAECSYFSQLIAAYDQGRRSFGNHTKYYFDSLDEFRDYNRGIVSGFLERTAARLGHPAILALKDPMLTARFALVAELLPATKFVIISRDPRDAVASRVRVLVRGQKGAPASPAQIDQYCNAYNGIYNAAADLRERLPHAVCLVNYETLVASRDFSPIASFLGTTLRPEKMWQDGVTDYAAHKKNPFFSDLYLQPMSAEATGTFGKTLTPEQADRVLSLCAKTAKRVDVPL